MSQQWDPRRLLSELTQAEKASLMSGHNFWHTKAIERLDIPSIMLTDGPHGLRKQEVAGDHLGLNKSLPSTCFPTAATLANSWDVDLLEQVGAALGAEAAAESVRVLLGPGMNIKRNPLAGRNFEYFSEDPLTTGTLAASFIRGVQSRGVAASAKHFAVNSQEHRRMTIDEIVDDRAFHEIYLEGFRIAVTQATPWTIMSSYNRVNGIYANENRELLVEILRKRWGFDGLVVTDWGGNNNRVAGLLAGNALEMPSTDGSTDQDIVNALDAGMLDESVLDARVAELLTLIERTAAAEGEGAATTGQASAHLHAPHHELAIEAARRSIVLLENRGGTLPLALPGTNKNEGQRIAVIGDFAGTPRYQGAGSSLVNPSRIDSPLSALQATGLNITGYEPGFSRRDSRSRRRAKRAVDLAQRSDLVLLFLGLDESAEAESVDRTHMRLAQNQLDLADQLLGLGIPIVVVLAGGSPVELPFADRASAIVHGYLAGQGGGSAIADVLTGRVNPSGKLSESYPLSYTDVPSASDYGKAEATAEHRESIYIGYRYFDKVSAPVRYPFGYGLSYTSFAYSELQAGPEEAQLSITNTGNVAGTEIVQLYVEAPNQAQDTFRAIRELRGFARVTLEPGEQRRLTIRYAEHAFDVFDTVTGNWLRVPGDYTVQAAASSRDIRLEAPLEVGLREGAGDDPHRTIGDLAPRDLSPHYLSGHIERVTSDEFAGLLGRPLPPANWPTGGELTREHTIEQMRGRGGFAGLLYFVIDRSRAVLMALGKPLHANNTRFVLELPFRSVSRMSGGMMNEEMLDAFLVMVNGHFFRGTRDLWSAWRRKRAAERSHTKG